VETASTDQPDERKLDAGEKLNTDGDPSPEFEPDDVIEQRLIRKCQERIRMKKIASASALLPAPKPTESGYNSESEKASPTSSGSGSKLPDSAANSPDLFPEAASSLKFSSPESIVSGKSAVGSLAESPESVQKADQFGDTARARPRPRSILDISLRNAGVQKRVSLCCHWIVNTWFITKS